MDRLVLSAFHIDVLPGDPTAFIAGQEMNILAITFSQFIMVIEKQQECL